MSQVRRYRGSIKSCKVVLIPTVIHKSDYGEGDEIVYLPKCSRCKGIITMLDSATIEGVHGKPKPIGKMDEISISILRGANIYHAGCAPKRRRGPRVNAGNVIKSRQRGEHGI